MKKVVLKDIAQHVGVSTALVSYVLNGQAIQKQVGREVAEKIRIAAAELNYQPNQIAKSLKIRKTNTLGLVVADIKYRFSTGITRAIEEEAKRLNYTVIFASSNEDPDKFTEVTNVLVNRQVDGLILVPGENAEKQILLLQQSEIPFVLIDRYFPEIKTNYIALDNYRAAYDATTYLLKLGHRRISLFNYKSTMYHLLERNRGYMDAITDFNVIFRPEWLRHIENSDTPKPVEQHMEEILSMEEPCDAVFFATDTLALNGLKYLNKNGKQAPEDISVFCFDDSEAFDLYKCPITHGSQPLEEMGKIAVNTLSDLILHNKAFRQVNLQANFVVGKSCRE